jgi:hypothetical protein
MPMVLTALLLTAGTMPAALPPPGGAAEKQLALSMQPCAADASGAR